MDEARMAYLREKAATRGVSAEEAVELGRLFAEAKGKPYSDAAAEHAAQRRRDPFAAERSARSWFRRFLGNRRLEIEVPAVPGAGMEEDQAIDDAGSRAEAA